MSRRSFLVLAAAAAVGTGVPHAREQLPMPPGGRPWRIGWLHSGDGPDDPASKWIAELVVAALRDKGWRLGEHFLLDIRFVAGDASRYPMLADELIARHPDVLYGLQTAAQVLVTKTRTIPIVMATSIDPVGAGLVKSLAAPGTNVTGMTGQTDEVVAKQVELLVELMPGARRIALLFDLGWAGEASARAHAERAARVTGRSLTLAPVTDADSVYAAVQRMVAEGVGGVVIFPTPGVHRLAGEIGPALRRARMPSVGGGVASLSAVIDFGQDYADQYRQSADFIDQIFRGAKPADLPVRQATRYVLGVNLKAARELGIDVPRSILVRADKVIQ
jgi:putative ABC transport system substrate-binding protein